MTAQVTAERGAMEKESLSYKKVAEANGKEVTRIEQLYFCLQHQLAEARAMISELQQANSLVVSLQRECREARVRIKDLESEKHTQQCQDMEGT